MQNCAPQLLHLRCPFIQIHFITAVSCTLCVCIWLSSTSFIVKRGSNHWGAAGLCDWFSFLHRSSKTVLCFSWNILFAFWSRTQLIQLNDTSAEVRSLTLAVTFHSKVEHEEQIHWGFVPMETINQREARNQRPSIRILLSWKPTFITPVCMKRKVSKT